MNPTHISNSLVKRVFTLGVLLCLISTGAYVLTADQPEVSAAPSFQMESALPEGSLLHIAFSGAKGCENANQLALAELMRDPQMGRFMQPGLEMAEMMGEEMMAEFEQNMGISPNEILAALQGGMTLTLVDVDMGDGNAPPMIDAILTADLGGNEELISKIAGVIDQGVRGGLEMQPTAVKIGGHEGFCISVEGINVNWVIADQHLLIGTQIETMAAVAQRVKAGVTTGGLAESASFVKASSKVAPSGSSVLLAYGDVNAIMGVVDSLPIDDEVPVAAFVDLLGLDALDSFAYALSIEGRGIVDRSWIGAPNGMKGIYAGLKHSSNGLRTPAMAPENSFVYGGFRFELDALAQNMLTFIGEVEPRAKDEVADGMAKAEEQFGFSILNDFVPTLGAEMAFWVAPSPYGGLIPELVIAVELDAPDKFQEYLGTVLQQTAGEMISATEFMGQQINYVDTGAFMNEPEAFGVGIKPCWMIRDSFLLIAAAPQTLKNMMVSNRDGRPNMTANTDMGNSLASLRQFNANAGTDSLSYVDLASVAMLLIDTAAPLAQSVHFPEEVPVDMTQFPTSDVFQRHLFGLTGASYYGPDGILSEMVSPTGYLPVVGGLLAGAGMALFAVERSSAASMEEYHLLESGDAAEPIEEETEEIKPPKSTTRRIR